MKKKKKVGLVTKILFGFVAIYAAFTLISLQLQINEQKNKIAELSEQNRQQEIKNEQYRDVINEDEAAEEYISQIAHDKLKYGSNGERVFIDAWGK